MRALFIVTLTFACRIRDCCVATSSPSAFGNVPKL